jgi:predicted RNA-binding Zn ribbon-like protein
MTDASGALGAAIPSDDLCLSYANTRYWRGTPEPTETLHAIGDVTEWVAQAVPAAAPLAARCAAQWQADPEAGGAALAEALALREVLHAALGAVAAGQPAELAALNRALGQAAPRRQLVRADGGYGWRIEAGPVSAARLLSGVLWSAADLLAGPRRARLRACANPKCGWLFIDDSKSGNRRWCSMSACGNRAKAHRHYVKVREAKGKK